jgi:DNA-binding response OmpR family regulator
MKRILVIEDEEAIRKNIAQILEFEGYQVVESSDGKSGLSLAIDSDFDLILCDIMMPVMDGYEVLEKLKVQKTPPPFIFITALSGRTDFRTGMNLGADDYLTKPFTLKELTDCVKAQLVKNREKGNHNNHVEKRISELTLLMEQQKVELERISKISTEDIIGDNLTQFQLRFNHSYPSFNRLITEAFPQLSQTDLIILSGIASNLTSLQLALLLNVQPESIRKSKFRLKKKMGIMQDDIIEKTVRQFLIV